MKNIYSVSKYGSFYNCYGKDAYILSYMFNYKMTTIENNVAVCGFSKNAINKVMAKLENEKINYMVMDTRNNYDVDYQIDYKNLNEYEETFERARRYVRLKRKIDKISEKLIEEIKKDTIEEKLKKVEEIVNES